MVIVYCSDNNGADFMVVSIKSLFANNAGLPVDVHIITDGFSAESVSAIHELELAFSRTITIHSIDSSGLDSLPIVDLPELKIPVAAYFRLFIPDLLPASIRKAIYLDSDTIVVKPLLPLWETDLEGNLLGAVADPAFADTTHPAEIGLGENDIYFNSGMMLMDLDRMRAEGTSRRCIQWVESNPEKASFPDQDAINHIALGRVRMLHPRYNLHYYIRLRVNYGIYISPEEFEEGVSDPAIVHFSGYKPWLRYHWGMKKLDKKLFDRYRRLFPETHLRRRPVMKTRSFPSYCVMLFKQSRITGRIYALNPQFFSRLIVSGRRLRHRLPLSHN